MNFRISCDEDGWVVRVEGELAYPHFFHFYPIENITSVLVKGDFIVNFLGFGDESKLILSLIHIREFNTSCLLSRDW